MCLPVRFVVCSGANSCVRRLHLLSCFTAVNVVCSDGNCLLCVTVLKVV